MCAYITYTHTKENYSVIKKNEIMPFAETWMDLNSSEIRQRTSAESKKKKKIKQMNEYNKTKTNSQTENKRVLRGEKDGGGAI